MDGIGCYVSSRSLTGRPSAIFYPGQFRKEKGKAKPAAAAVPAGAQGCPEKPISKGR